MLRRIMHQITVRAATPDDWRIVVDFNARLAEESESKRLDPETVSLGVQAALADPAKCRYFVAQSGQQIVGQLMHTWEWSDWRNGYFWWLQSVYVLPDFRGQGVFRRLYDHLHNLADADGAVVGLRLYVETENHPARATYSRLGLQPTGYVVMEKPFSACVQILANGAGAENPGLKTEG
jgi:GNAT superfamily N-acetyltransferase